MNFLDEILQQKKILHDKLEVVISNDNQLVANKVAAIIYGEPHSTSKKAKVVQVLRAAGLVPQDAKVHVKHGALIASQVGAAAVKREYVAALIHDRFYLVSFDPREAHLAGVSPHGKRSKSDAKRVNVDAFCVLEFIERVNFEVGPILY